MPQYGGGRTIRPGESLETEEERAGREAKTRQLLENYRKVAGLDMDAGTKARCQQVIDWRAALPTAPYRIVDVGNCEILGSRRCLQPGNTWCTFLGFFSFVPPWKQFADCHGQGCLVSECMTHFLRLLSGPHLGFSVLFIACQQLTGGRSGGGGDGFRSAWREAGRGWMPGG